MPSTFNGKSRKEDGVSFEEWMKLIDIQLPMLSHEDFPDRNYRDEYDEGMSPAEVARDVMAENGFGDEDSDIYDMME